MRKRICIDPGHAPGNANKGPSGYYEYAAMWKLSAYIKTALERCGFEVSLTRTENQDPPLITRGQTAKDFDLFISEHSNAANGSARGVEVYYSVDLPGDKSFAAAMSKELSTLMGNADRGAKTRENEKSPGEDYYGVIDAAQDIGCPHVLLIENGFHDNTIDEAFLKSDDNLKAIAETQVKVIRAYLDVSREDESVVPSSVTGTPILGKSEVAVSTLAQFLLSYNPTPKLTSVNAMQLAELYINEGAIEGVRGDIAFCQSLVETNWFNYGKDVKWDQNNYSGIGATGNGNPGNSFKTPQEGVRAQIQHLKAYSSTEALKQPCVDPRYGYVQKGCAKNWGELSGLWASDKSYGEKILARYALLKSFVPSTTVPAPSAKTVTEIAQEVIKGLWGNGIERTTRLTGAGYNPTEIQTMVNSILNGATSASAEFKPYLIRITAPALNVRNEPSVGADSKIVKCLINDKNTYTIIAESDGQGATKWGKLKSGLGWISLDYTKKV